VLVVNTSRGDAYVDPRFAREPDLDRVVRELTAAGVPHTVRQLVRVWDAAEEIVEIVEAENRVGVPVRTQTR
jgi:hypothetical protein